MAKKKNIIYRGVRYIKRKIEKRKRWEESRKASSFNKNGYVKSATYMGDEWQFNFWNSDFTHLDRDMKRIADDGFDSIIIVIPWREFMPSVEPIEYNDYPFQRLKQVMEAAAARNLSVYARIGYTWDFYNDENESIYERYLNIFRFPHVRAAWLEYAKRINDELRQYPNFRDAFITWEDFWYSLFVGDIEELDTRVRLAEDMGYREWLRLNFAITDYNFWFATNYTNYEEIPVPRKEEPAWEAFYMFYDDFLIQLLIDTQKVFPNLSMEVRLDDDLVTKKEGYKRFYSHRKTFCCQNSDYVCTMFAIHIDSVNKGEKLSVLGGMRQAKKVLKKLNNEIDGKPIYMDQYLFKDNTIGFSNNAQIKANQLGLYLENIHRVFKKYSAGYAIWTYRDYYNNMLYNSSFQLEGKGWNVTGSPAFNTAGDACSCTMEEGDSIAQHIPTARNGFHSGECFVSLRMPKNLSESQVQESQLQISVGEECKLITIKTGQEKIDVDFKEGENLDFKIEVIKGTLTLNRVIFYTFVQKGNLYDPEWNELEYIKNIRVLNKNLSK